MSASDNRQEIFKIFQIILGENNWIENHRQNWPHDCDEFVFPLPLIHTDTRTHTNARTNQNTYTRRIVDTDTIDKSLSGLIENGTLAMHPVVFCSRIHFNWAERRRRYFKPRVKSDTFPPIPCDPGREREKGWKRGINTYVHVSNINFEWHTLREKITLIWCERDNRMDGTMFHTQALNSNKHTHADTDTMRERNETLERERTHPSTCTHTPTRARRFINSLTHTPIHRLICLYQAERRDNTHGTVHRHSLHTLDSMTTTNLRRRQ